MVEMERKLDPMDFPEVRFLTLREYNFLQIEHIQKHKWYLSEEAGFEISIEDACHDWVKSGIAKDFRDHFKIIT